MPNHTLQFVPIEELKQLRDKRCIRYDAEVYQKPVEISGGDGISFESRLILDLKKTEAHRIIMELRSDGEKKTIVTVDLKKGQLIVDRNQSDGWGAGIAQSNLVLKGKETLEIHIFSDRSSIEIFSSNYQMNHSCNIFTEGSQNTVYAEGGKAVFSCIESFGLKRMKSLPKKDQGGTDGV